MQSNSFLCIETLLLLEIVNVEGYTAGPTHNKLITKAAAAATTYVCMKIHSGKSISKEVTV